MNAGDEGDTWHSAARVRTRATAASATRIELLARLVRALAGGPLDTAQVGEVLGFALSSARKYARDLVNAGIVRQVSTPKASHLFYLNSMTRAEAWLARLRADEQALAAGRTVKQARPQRALPPGLHLMQDDVPFQIRRYDAGPPRRDPLVAALFGPRVDNATPIPQADTEPLERAVTPQPERRSEPFDWQGGRIDWEDLP